MKFLSLDMIKAHCRIEENYEDALLEEYGESAEELVLHLMNRSLDSLTEEYGNVPVNVKHACYLLINHSTKYREPMSMQNLYRVDYSVDALLKPYMILQRMAYQSGFLDKRVTILSREASKDTAFGRTGGQFVPVQTVWANCAYNKGMKAMREGAMDAYETYMVRMMWHEKMKRECRLSWDGRIYQVESLKEDKKANEMQIICTEIQK